MKIIGNQNMNDRRRLFFLILILAAVASFSTGITTYLLYDTAFQENRERLAFTMTAQARMVESIAIYEKKEHPDRNKEETFIAVMARVIPAFRDRPNFGRTGEFSLGRLNGDIIEFILQRPSGTSTIPFDSNLAKPMRQALLGQSGTLVGLDYRGETVLAAYEMVEGLNLGVVAKIDMAEIREPFIRTGILTGLLALIAILAGAFLFFLTTNTVFKRIRENEEKFRNLFEHANDSIFISDPSTKRFIDINENAAKRLGYTRDELLQMKVDELVSPQTAYRTDGIIRELRETGHVIFEHTHIRKDGTEMPIEVSSRLIDIGGRKIIESFVRDISERKQSEEDLRKSMIRISEMERDKAREAFRSSEARFEAIANYTYDWESWIGNDGELLWINPAVERVTGYTVEECMAMQDYPLPIVCPDDQAKFKHQLSKPSGNDIEFRCLRKNGTPAWMAISWQQIFDKDSNKIGVRSSVRDISERIKVRDVKQLNDSRQTTLLKLYQMLERPLQEIFVYVLEEGQILTESEIGFIGLLDSDEKFMTSQAWSQNTTNKCVIIKIPTEFSIENSGLWGDAVRLKKPIIVNNYQSTSNLPEGHIKLERFMTVPLFHMSRITALISVGNKNVDYTQSDIVQLQLLMEGMWHIVQRKRSDEQIRNALREKEVLLKEVHHRVKNNMQVISSLLGLQALRSKSDRVKKVFENSKNRVGAMALVHETLYRSESLSEIGMKQYIEGLTDNLLSTYGDLSERISLNLNIENFIMGLDEAIPCGLIINELISNSLEHAFPNRANGIISIESHLEAKKTVIIKISDNGIGIDKDYLENSEAFGLSLVTMLVEDQLGGSLQWVKGEGAIFEIKFDIHEKINGD